MTTIAELQDRAYQQSADKGFHDNQPTTGREALARNAERLALIHAEVSEALEALRDGLGVNTTHYLHASACLHRESVDCVCTPKPEGVPSELADVVIRVLDFCGANGINLQEAVVEKLQYNATRPHEHGKEF